MTGWAPTLVCRWQFDQVELRVWSELTDSLGLALPRAQPYVVALLAILR